MKIIIVEYNMYSKSNYARLGVELLTQKGYDVRLWDITSIAKPIYFNNYTLPAHQVLPQEVRDKIIFIQKRDHFHDLVKGLTNDDIVIVPSNLNTVFSYAVEIFTLYNIRFGTYLLTTFLGINCKLTLFQLVKFHLRNPISSFKKIIFKFYNKHRLPVWAPEFILVGGEEESQRVASFSTSDSFPHVIKAHTFDYDTYLREENYNRDRIIKGKEYAVFIDEYLTQYDCQDFVESQASPVITAEEYYPSLNKLFEYIENQFNLEVIVAAHPLSNYDKSSNPYNNRKMICHETINLVKHSTLVLTHNSTSLCFAVLYYKPMVFLAHKAFSDPLKNLRIQLIAKYFGVTPIELSNNNRYFNPLPMVDSDTYDRYKFTWIKEKGTKEKYIWDIFSDYLKK